MPETFPQPRAPSIQSSGEVEADTLEVSFGDGYGQGAANGINSVREKMSVVWENVTFAEYETMNAFLKARAGYQGFLWTMPHETTPRLWKCKKWNRSSPSGNLFNFTATFIEVF